MQEAEEEDDAELELVGDIMAAEVWKVSLVEADNGL